MQRSDPNRRPPNTLSEKLRCIAEGNPQHAYIQELIRKHKEKYEPRKTHFQTRQWYTPHRPGKKVFDRGVK